MVRDLWSWAGKDLMMSSVTNDLSAGSDPPLGAPELSLASDVLVASTAERLVDQAKASGVALTGDGGLLTDLVRQVLQGALDAELTDHLGYPPHAVEGRGSGNSRNGSYPKTLRTEIGDVDVRVPRDRNGTFEPVTVPVGQRRLSGLDQMVISLYAKGLTTGDIASHLFDVYDQDVDRSTISRITDQIVDDMLAWQSRPLDAVYPVVFIDGIRIKIRDGNVSNRVVYVVMGINMEGERDILGLWVGPTGGESPKFWMSVMAELKNRGGTGCCAETIYVACYANDAASGLPAGTWQHLPKARRRRRVRGRVETTKRNVLGNITNISERTPAAAERTEQGHWEGDGEFQRSVHGPGMIAGAVDHHRPLEIPGCQVRRCRRVTETILQSC